MHGIELVEVKGDLLIAAPLAGVWAALNDPLVLCRAIAGLQLVASEVPSRFLATFTPPAYLDREKWAGEVILSDLVPPHEVLIMAERSGPPQGYVKAWARIMLRLDETGTRLSYVAGASFGPALAIHGADFLGRETVAAARRFFATLADIVPAYQWPRHPMPEQEETARAAAIAEIADTTPDPSEALIAVAAMAPEAMVEIAFAKDGLERPDPDAPGLPLQEAMVPGAAAQLHAAHAHSDPPGEAEGKPLSTGRLTPGGRAETMSLDPVIPLSARTPGGDVGGLPPIVWISGLILAVGILLWFFTRYP